MLSSKTGNAPRPPFNNTAWSQHSLRQLLDRIVDLLLPRIVLSKLRWAEFGKSLLDNILKSPPMFAKSGFVTNDTLGAEDVVEDFG